MCQGIFIFFLIGLRVHDPDHYFYQVEYLSAPSIYYKFADFPGWNLWMNFFINKGYVFSQFILIMAAICVVLMLVGVYETGKKLDGYISFALAIFLIYPLGHEATQMRTFFADALIFSVLPFLLEDVKDLKRKILNYSIYFGIVYIAITIHTLSYFFILVGIVFILLKTFKYEFQIIITSSIIVGILINSNVLSDIITRFLNTGKQTHWMDNGMFSFGKLLPILITIIIWWIAHIEIKELCNTSQIISTEKRHLLTLQKFMNTIFLILPLLNYDITFNRLWRIYLMLLYLITGMYAYRNHKEKNKKKIYILCLFFITVFVIFIYENEMSILSLLF
ncbi:EpsG family protein [Lactobacillus helveticus]|uniref:EpsG family protein n=1 Tax=Lactobacillus helveticus TaxID=1587 RepID=UPI0021823A2A|nr:EpsG family protein [Lactobacillus helveticus]